MIVIGSSAANVPESVRRKTIGTKEESPLHGINKDM